MKVLNVEDNPRDSALIERELARRFPSLQLVRVETAEQFDAALREGGWDLVVADHRLPRFSSLAALEILRASSPDIPLIVVSGTMGLDFAVEAMRAGARDYLVKSDLVRLCAVAERELQDAAARRLEAERHAVSADVLESLNGTGDLSRALEAVLERLAIHAGASAAGIRLRVGDDFPYFRQIGFSPSFQAAETSLCVADGDEDARAGPPALACLCGAVLSRSEALAPVLTPRGSYVTGRLTEAIRGGGAAAQTPHLRGRCALEGFESLALIPLRSGPELVGLLQLNGRTRDRFDAGLVEFLEEVAPSIGLAVDRRRAQEALRASEERYRVLVETAPNGVALVGLDSTIMMANLRLAEMLGATSREELVGRRLVEFVPAEDRPRAEVALAAFVARGSPREGLVRFRNAKAAFDGELTASLASRDGAQASLVVMIRDVTEQLRLRARLAQSDRLASVGTLAAGVAHEINNPLTYILCNLESLEADLPAVEAALPPGGEPLELEKRAREALEGVRRIREIVRDLRVFSRSGSDRRELVSLNKVLQGAVNMTHNEVKYRARLVAAYDDVPPVLANEGRLAQVFLNLLVNAAQAIREGDLERNTIWVRTWQEDDAVLAEVRDTGAGIPPEAMGKVFEPFFTTKPAGVGTGLGLSISRGIVEEAGGSISVESQPGRGTRFVVRLPVGRAPPPAQEAARPGEASVALSRRGRVLVVDDEEFVRAAVVRLLRAAHDVVEATSGHHAESLLARDDRFDVILTDLLMPDVSGMDLHDGLLAARPDLAARVVFMSGGVFTPRASAFLESVPNLRIDKPFDPKALRKLIDVLVAGADGA